MSPHDLTQVIQQQQNKPRVSQGTAQQRFRSTAANWGQGQQSPINVINNSLNITIFRGQQKEQEERAKTRSRARNQYYTEQLASL
jgi:hypothetical protein